MKGNLLDNRPAVAGGISAGFTDDAVADPVDVVGYTDSVLQDQLGAAFAERRRIDAAIARLSAEVVSRSRPSLGPDGLARRNGSGDAAGLIAQIGRITRAEAHRFCRVGDATSCRRSLTGELLPPAFPTVAVAFSSGELPLDSSHHIITQLTQAAQRADASHLVEAERALVAFAEEAVADDVRTLAVRWRDALDVDGIEPREEAMIVARSLRRVLLPNGLKRYVLDLDPLGAAYLDAAIDAEVTTSLRKVRFVSEAGADESNRGDPADADPRTIAQMGADVIVDLARHGLSCADTTAPLAAATVVVRMSVDALRTGLGAAQIDGGEQAISAGAARRLAAEGEIIPIVLGGDSEVLDMGRTRRAFTRAQRLAIAERDGGCAFGTCRRPPSHTEAHHLRWWVRDFGPSDLDNGVLLCTRHHHQVHRDGWEIRLLEGRIWFIPPPTIDVHRTPRASGRLLPPELKRHKRQSG